MKGFDYFETKIAGLGQLTIIRCVSQQTKEFMDQCVLRYVATRLNNQPYIELTEKKTDSGYLRVLLCGINDIEFKPFEF